MKETLLFLGLSCMSTPLLQSRGVSTPILTGKRILWSAVNRPFSSSLVLEKKVGIDPTQEDRWPSKGGSAERLSAASDSMYDKIKNFIPKSENKKKPFIRTGSTDDKSLRWNFKGKLKPEHDPKSPHYAGKPPRVVRWTQEWKWASFTPNYVISDGSLPTEAPSPSTGAYQLLKELNEASKSAKAWSAYADTQIRSAKARISNLMHPLDWKWMRPKTHHKIPSPRKKIDGKLHKLTWNKLGSSSRLPLAGETIPKEHNTPTSPLLYFPFVRRVYRYTKGTGPNPFMSVPKGPEVVETEKSKEEELKDRWILPPEQTNLKLLPNLRKMKLSKQIMDLKLFHFFGISSKTQSKTELWGWRNRKQNKYLIAQYKRLIHFRGPATNRLGDMYSPKGVFNNLGSKFARANHGYWNMAYFLIKHSTVFRTVYFNHAFSRWEKNMSLRIVLDILYRVEALVRTGDWTKLHLTRVWIDNFKRPLGVPGSAHRVVGAQMAALLEFYMVGTIKHNHAYQYKKGTGTAWHQMLNDVIRIEGKGQGWPFIYEYDISGFFNNVSHKMIVEVLRGIGCPSWLWLGTLLLQQCAPNLPGETYEKQQRGRKAEFRNLIPTKGSHKRGRDVISLSRGNTGGPITDRLLDRSAGSNKHFFYEGPYNPKGVAQGHNLSPLLSILVLDLALQMYKAKCRSEGYEVELVQYADDGVISSTHPKVVDYWGPILKEITGCSIAKDKSHVVREGYKWRRKLKFLGLLYDPYLDRLFASTRKGSRICLDRSITQFHNIWTDLTVMGEMFVRGKIVKAELVKTEFDNIFFMFEPYSLGEIRIEPVQFTEYKGKPHKLTHLGQGVFKCKEATLWDIARRQWGIDVDYSFTGTALEATKTVWTPVFWPLKPLYAKSHLLIYWANYWLPYHSKKTWRWIANSMSFYAEARTQAITWRSVMKAKKLNSFMARLYYGQMEDYKPKQDFRLDPYGGSLLGILKSAGRKETVTEKGWWQIGFDWADSTGRIGGQVLRWIASPLGFTSRTYERFNWNRSAWSMLEEDLEVKVDTFNSSTVGTYLLPQILKEIRRSGTLGSYSCAPLPKGKGPRCLAASFLSRLNLGGYWSVSDSENGHWNMFSEHSWVNKDCRGPRGFSLSHITPSTRRVTDTVVKDVDWYDCFSSNRLHHLGGDRVRTVKEWFTNHTLKLARVYENYRPLLCLARDDRSDRRRPPRVSLNGAWAGKVWGWVPVRKRRYHPDGKPTSNPISMVPHPMVARFADEEMAYALRYTGGNVRPLNYLGRRGKGKLSPNFPLLYADTMALFDSTSSGPGFEWGPSSPDMLELKRKENFRSQNLIFLY